MSTEPKFTPGPWKVRNGDLIRVGSYTQGQNLIVCGVHKMGIHGGQSLGDPLANAHLIATAPELYESFSAAMDFIKSNVADPDITNEMADAYNRLMSMNPERILAKARGEQEKQITGFPSSASRFGGV